MAIWRRLPPSWTRAIFSPTSPRTPFPDASLSLTRRCRRRPRHPLMGHVVIEGGKKVSWRRGGGCVAVDEPSFLSTSSLRPSSIALPRLKAWLKSLGKRDYFHPGIVVRHSQIAGYGLFATMSIKKGELISYEDVNDYAVRPLSLCPLVLCLYSPLCHLLAFRAPASASARSSAFLRARSLAPMLFSSSCGFSATIVMIDCCE